MVITKMLGEDTVRRLQAGEVGILPTDTVYGLCCSTANKHAVERLYTLKDRQQKPGTVLAADVGQLVSLGFPRRYIKAVEQFWPNPVSIVLPTTATLAYLDQGKMSLAVRIPADGVMTMLLQQTGPLLTSCANPPGQPVANTVAEAQAYFGEGIDFYVDGGDMSSRQPSTIIRVVDDVVEMIREGAVRVSDRGEIL